MAGQVGGCRIEKYSAENSKTLLSLFTLFFQSLGEDTKKLTNPLACLILFYFLVGGLLLVCASRDYYYYYYFGK